jgi:hypothetical protein
MKTKETQFRYKIKISYQTGDSFKNEDTESTLEIGWNNLDIAKENLQFIKEHYEMYDDLDIYHPRKTKEQWYEQNQNKEWFVYEKSLYYNDCRIDESSKHKYDPHKLKYMPDDNMAQNCIKLKLDDGSYFQMYCFWCGYFERLYYAEIECDDNDMKITFN